MKRLFWLFIALIPFGNAQFPLTRTEFPVPDTFNLYYDIDPTGVSPGNAGSNVMWDFSTAQFDAFNSHDTVRSYSPQNVPGNANFPSANLALDEYLSVAFGATAKRYLFLDKNPAYLLVRGFHVPYNDLSTVLPGVQIFPQTYVYSTPDTFFLFPFSYGDSITFPFVFSQINVGTTQDTVLYGWHQRTIVADAYGTLKLPSGRIFNNVLRVKIFTERNDTIKQISLNTDLYYENVFATEYAWFVKDTGLVFLITEVNGVGYSPLIGPVNINSYRVQEINPSKTTTKLPKDIAKIIGVYVAGKQIKIKDRMNSYLEIYSLQGQKILARKITAPEEIIELPRTGIYILRIDNNSFKIYLYEH